MSFVSPLADCISSFNRQIVQHRNDVRFLSDIFLFKNMIRFDLIYNFENVSISISCSDLEHFHVDQIVNISLTPENKQIEWKIMELLKKTKLKVLDLYQHFHLLVMTIQNSIENIEKVPRELELWNCVNLIKEKSFAVDLQLSLMNAALCSARCKPVSLLCPCMPNFLVENYPKGPTATMEAHLVDYEKLRTAIDGIPSLTQLVNVSNWLNLSPISDCLLQNLLLAKVQFQLTNYPFVSSVQPDAFISVSLPSNPAFNELSERFGTFTAYHGSPLENWYSIINNGLLDMSYSKGMQSGAIYGRGIYLSEDLSLSKLFSASLPAWNHSFISSHLEIVGVYKVAKVPGALNFTSNETGEKIPEKYVVVKNSSCLQLVGLCLWKSNSLKKNLSSRSKSLLFFGFLFSIILVSVFTYLSFNTSLSSSTKKLFKRIKWK